MNWQEALAVSGLALHGGNPLDATVNRYNGCFACFLRTRENTDPNFWSAWKDDIATEEEVTAFLRTHGIDPDTGWHSPFNTI